jgi:Na+-driven multidrug efflux pump
VTARRGCRVVALTETILDPVMIFGLLGFPKMGIRGAVWAAVFCEAIVMAGGFVLLCGRYRLLSFTGSPAAAILASWGRTLRIGASGTLSSVLAPLFAGVVTSSGVGAWTGWGPRTRKRRRSLSPSD